MNDDKQQIQLYWVFPLGMTENFKLIWKKPDITNVNWKTTFCNIQVNESKVSILSLVFLTVRKDVAWVETRFFFLMHNF